MPVNMFTDITKLKYPSLRMLLQGILSILVSVPILFFFINKNDLHY